MSVRCPDLPFLPGYSFNPRIGKTKFNMDPKFDFISEGVPALVEKVKPQMFGALSDKYPSVYPRGEVSELPAWIAFDKQMLCFEAYFKETLQEVRGAPYQVRAVKIYYFLEDGTIMVVEPRVENSGVSQGTLITRHRIRFPAPMDDSFYEMIDLNVGREVEFYGRVFKLTNCDKFTRNFLNRCGIAVPDPSSIPPDPYFEVKRREASLGKQKGGRKVHSLEKFLKFDQKVLHFYGYWDDQETTYGYLHRLEVLYFLADDTIQIKEVKTESCTKTSTFTFLHRAKLPKNDTELPGPGAAADLTVLNVLGPGLQGGRYVKDPLSCGMKKVDFYTEKDLSIGSVLNCYGRKFVLCDCDNFTKEYYSKKYGITDFEPIEMPKDKDEAPVQVDKKERELPPWNGYGSFEDSAQNCITVEPKAPHKDFKKFLRLDRDGLDSHMLRFAARMVSNNEINRTRDFIIKFYLADDTIAVFEYARKNSGFASKQFYSRMPMALPGQDFFTSKPPIYFKSQDMYVGAQVTINSFKFALINADEYAFRYMELNPNQYHKSNIKVIMEKIRDKLKPTYKDFVAENMPQETAVISYDKLKLKLCDLLGDNFTEHEMITISRAFPAQLPIEEKYDRTEIRAITFTQLKKMLWDDLTRLKEYFIMRDPERKGALSRKECYTVIRGCRLPLDQELIDKILKVIVKDDQGNLCYQDILDFFDSRKCILPDKDPINIKHELSCVEVPLYKISTHIDWCAFNEFLDLEDTFKEQRGPNTIESLKTKQ